MAVIIYSPGGRRDKRPAEPRYFIRKIPAKVRRYVVFALIGHNPARGFTGTNTPMGVVEYTGTMTPEEAVAIHRKVGHTDSIELKYWAVPAYRVSRYDFECAEDKFIVGANGRWKR